MYGALRDAGVIGNPYYRFNDDVYRWIHWDDWTFNNTFTGREREREKKLKKLRDRDRKRQTDRQTERKRVTVRELWFNESVIFCRVSLSDFD